MKLCSRKIASGRPKIVCAIHTGQNEFCRPKFTKIVCSGMRATCNGTICSAKIATNRKSRPLKSIQANAYAASSARVIGMSTAGSTMTNEFRKNPARPPEPLKASV